MIAMTRFVPVVLAGGSGTRLWPLSRKNFPKQFLQLHGKDSLLQASIRRLEQSGATEALIVCNEAHYFLCQEQLERSSLNLHYLLEPVARNTAPAIALAALHLQKTHRKNVVLVVLPSDHWIGDDARWQQAITNAATRAGTEGSLITFGIRPDSPKTGYGYIEGAGVDSAGFAKVRSFREKPDAATAQDFIQSGQYFWNSGMFAFRADSYLNALKQHAQDIYDQCVLSANESQQQQNYLRVDEARFAACRSESIDYAIMEHTNQAEVLPIDLPWSDLGCWSSVSDIQDKDIDGNTLLGPVVARDSKNCHVSSTNTLVTTLGLQDSIVVATEDAILVADKAYSQQVKDMVASLQLQHDALTHDHKCVSRPWGSYEVLAEGKAFKVKRLMVKPGAKLSLQRHQHRAEHWVVVGGIADVTLGEEHMRLLPNQSTYISPRTIHRLANPGQEPLFVIEVQTGSYLGEDDIERIEDIYHRKERQADAKV